MVFPFEKFRCFECGQIIRANQKLDNLRKGKYKEDKRCGVCGQPIEEED